MKTNFTGRRRAEKRLRLGLLFLAATALYPGVWALVWPQSFSSDFPGLGLAWLKDLPPYNEHLVREVGAFYLAFGVLLSGAAWIMDRRLTQLVLAAWLVFAIPHLWSHISDGGEITEIAGIGLTVVIALILLPLSRRAEKRLG